MEYLLRPPTPARHLYDGQLLPSSEAGRSCDHVRNPGIRFTEIGLSKVTSDNFIAGFGYALEMVMPSGRTSFDPRLAYSAEVFRTWSVSNRRRLQYPHAPLR